MKSSIYKVIGFPLITMAIVYLGMYIGDNEYHIDTPVNVEYFQQGQILEPDYAVPEPLKVRDAKGLNRAIAPIEQGLVEATDGDIAEIMYEYCDVVTLK